MENGDSVTRPGVGFGIKTEDNRTTYSRGSREENLSMFFSNYMVLHASA